MNQTIKRRMAELSRRTTQRSNGVIFVTRLESGGYEVRHQKHSKSLEHSIAIYQSEEDAQQAIDKIVAKGDRIIFWDDIGVDDD